MLIVHINAFVLEDFYTKYYNRSSGCRSMKYLVGLLPLIAIALAILPTPIHGELGTILTYQNEYALDTTTYNVSFYHRQYSAYSGTYGSVAYLSSENRYAVAWVRIASEQYKTGYIYVSIIDPTSSTIEATVQPNTLDDNRPQTIVAGESKFLVAYYYWAGTTNKYDVAAAFIEKSGGSWVANEVEIATSTDYEEYVSAAYTNGKFLVVYYDSVDKKLYGAVLAEDSESITASGSIVGVNSNYKNTQFTVIPGDGNFLIVYKYYDTSVSPATDDIKAVLVDTNLNIIDQYTITSTTDYNETIWECRGGAYLGGKFFFTYNKPLDSTNELHLVILDPDTGSINDITLSSDGKYSHVTAGSTKVLVSWREPGASDNGNIKAALVDTSGSYIVLDISSDSSDTYREGYVWGAWSPGQNYFLLVWQRGSSGERGVYSRTVDENGLMGEISEIVTKTGESLEPAGLAADPNGYALFSVKYYKATSPLDTDAYSYSVLLGTDVPPPVFEGKYSLVTAIVVIAVVCILLIVRKH